MNKRPERASFAQAALSGQGLTREETGYETYIKVRLTNNQKAAIEQHADRAGMTVSAWVRACIRIAAPKEGA